MRSRPLGPWIVLSAVGLLQSCSSSNLAPTTVVIPPPAIRCPVAPDPVVVTGPTAQVPYGMPTVSGGTTPVTTTCEPASNSSFAVGITAVTCTATDAVHRTSTCAFQVTVTRSPLLNVTRILAFGDSQTEGEIPQPGEGYSLGPRLVMPDLAYPAALTARLAARYLAQGASRIDAFAVGPPQDCNVAPPILTSGITVVNGGCQGAKATDAATRARLADKLNQYRPQVVLLLAGVNDINEGVPVADAVDGLMALVDMVQHSGAEVLVATLLPQVPGGGRAVAPELVPDFNARLTVEAEFRGLSLVNLYQDFAGNVSAWISADGLHPTAAGYDEMSKVWFDAIERRFEAPATAAPAISAPAAVLTTRMSAPASSSAIRAR
jgi:lysophospholipase L1-like esterase